MRELEVECLPGDIPERIEVDVTDLGLHGAIRVSELKVSDKVKVLDDADQIVVHVVSVKEEAAPVAAAPAEGEAAAPAAAPAEPEVMKKGKKEEEPAE
jgi:large subunit ribosomal protein L25